MSVEQNWQPLSLLASQFAANLDAIAARDPALAQQLRRLPATTKLLSTATGQLRLGERIGESIREIPDPAPPTSARQIVTKVYPTGHCTVPLCVAGLGYGWIWQQLYTLPISTPALPGHRPPLYFMASDIEQLHAILHVHDWRAMLADERVMLFAGDDAYQQFERTLLTDTRIPWPKLAITVDPACWPPGKSLDGLVQSLFANGAKRLAEFQARHPSDSAGPVASAIPLKLERGESLRILGLTSRYTTFLQHSMRDWLDAFSRMGHKTRLIIEDADHQVMNNVMYAGACAEFRPDLIVLIDHYRAEFNAFPDDVPCVMWIQDRMPHLFTPKAGANQRANDYVIGYGRSEGVSKLGYPGSRFRAEMVGVNEHRFVPQQPNIAEADRYGCDVSFVSHCSTPAEAIVREQTEQSAGSPLIAQVIADVYEQLRAIYDAGGAITELRPIQAIIDRAIASARVRSDNLSGLTDFFVLRVNNAMLRHQALYWLADLGVRLKLYGRGWESHPRLAPFACGVADNQSQLAAVYRSSAINLQVTPHGAVHQRLLEGLSAGGFFLLRGVDGDDADRIRKAIWEWCVEHGTASDADLSRRATAPVRQLLSNLQRLTGEDPLALGYSLMDELAVMADANFTRSASTLFPVEYDRVAFRTQSGLADRVARLLRDEPERRSLAASMRQRVTAHMTYTKVTERLLNMIATDQAGRAGSAQAAA